MEEQSFMDRFFCGSWESFSGGSGVNGLFSFCFLRIPGLCFTFLGAETYVSLMRNVRFPIGKHRFSPRETYVFGQGNVEK